MLRKRKSAFLECLTTADNEKVWQSRNRVAALPKTTEVGVLFGPAERLGNSKRGSRGRKRSGKWVAYPSGACALCRTFAYGMNIPQIYYSKNRRKLDSFTELLASSIEKGIS